MTSRRVAIVGVGLITPIGSSWDGFARNLLAGISATRTISHFDATEYPSRVAAEVQDFSVSSYLEPPEARRVDDCYDRKIPFGIAASTLAMEDCGFQPEQVPPERVAISLGTSLSYPSVRDLETELHPFVGSDGEFDYSGLAEHTRAAPPAYPKRFLFDEVSRWLARRVGAGGGIETHFSACSASAQAVGTAFRKIRRGAADLCFAGGYDSMINPFGVWGFIRIGATTRHNDDPESACRPFDRTRDGMLLGEGAVVLVLEEWETALRNQRKIYGEIIGYGSSLDAAQITAPHPEARGAVLSMQRALKDAKLDPTEVDYVNAHGTATRLNDPMEARAIHEVFGEHAERLPVSSSKSMFGHLLAGAGAIEAAACLVAFDAQQIPPTINLHNPDPACSLDHVANQARQAGVRVAVSNSFAFGGQNATLVLKRLQQ